MSVLKHHAQEFKLKKKFSKKHARLTAVLITDHLSLTMLRNNVPQLNYSP